MNRRLFFRSFAGLVVLAAIIALVPLPTRVITRKPAGACRTIGSVVEFNGQLYMCMQAVVWHKRP